MITKLRLTVIAGVLTAVTGCGSGSTPEQSASDLNLVGGIATNLRPEVGRFRGCTATLYHQRYVITAAHCLNYPNYTDVTVKPTDRFSGVGLNGAAFSYPVSNIYSFARSLFGELPAKLHQ